ncbi:MAG: glycosyltransferase family 4 protein [Acidimicrobiia bacterium]
MASAATELAERPDVMKIAVVCPYDLGAPGGVQQVTVELVERLTGLGHQAWLVGPGRRDGARSVGNTVRIRANASVAPIALGPSVPRSVREAITEADVVHIHEPLMPRVSTAALVAGLPNVVTFHADAPRWVSTTYKLIPPSWREAMAHSVITAVSPVAARAIPPSFGPVEIIPNGVDVAGFGTGEKVSHRVAFLGRDEPRKGLDILLRAWPSVRAQIPDAELVVMGARRADPSPGVEFLGRVEETFKREMLASAAVYVAPNTGGESFGIVVAEAMAAGAAVVASDIPAFTAVLGGTGTIFPVGDSHRLAGEIVRLLNDPAEAARVGAVCRQRAAAFDWPTVVDRYLAAYSRARN